MVALTTFEELMDDLIRSIDNIRKSPAKLAAARIEKK